MKILVCIKQVPDDSVEIHLKDGAVDLANVDPIINAFDTYSLEMATRLKEKHGGEITVVSIGDESVKNSLKNCLAVGGDNAFLIKNDRAQSLSATGVAFYLKRGKEIIEEKMGEKFDVIFLGKESTDYATSQVGIILAQKLGLPVITNVIDANCVGDKLIVKQEKEDGYIEYELPLLSVLTVQKPEYEPRYPTIKTKMAARKKNIEEIAINGELTADIIKLEKVYEPQKKTAGIKINCEDPEEAVNKAFELIEKAKVL